MVDLVRNVNKSLFEIGADIKLNESLIANAEIHFLMLPMPNQTVYFLSVNLPKLSDLHKWKLQYDILFNFQEGIKVFRRRIVVRSLETLLIIEPDGLEFERMITLIEH